MVLKWFKKHVRTFWTHIPAKGEAQLPLPWMWAWLNDWLLTARMGVEGTVRGFSAQIIRDIVDMTTLSHGLFCRSQAPSMSRGHSGSLWIGSHRNELRPPPKSHSGVAMWQSRLGSGTSSPVKSSDDCIPCCPWAQPRKRPQARTAHLTCSQVPWPVKTLMLINVYCFKLLHFDLICYAAIE